tara:strand:+ start:2964 stop:3992 length:1029 start_codon:yes stop_codon:yes gene_type:complete
MKNLYAFILLLLIMACSQPNSHLPYTAVEVETLFEDSLSIRAIEIMGNSIAFAADQGTFGTLDVNTGKVRTNVEKYDSITPEFRAVAHTATDFFMFSIGSPALLYKTGKKGKMDLVYMEEGEDVFYDALTFWNDMEGIAVGDTDQRCLSIIITRDGGNTWTRVACSVLPTAIDGEGAFAASNTNIKTVGDKVWIGTTAGRIYYSGDKGNTWKAIQTPIKNDTPTHGIYSIDFFDENIGIAFGGDYSIPEGMKSNKALTIDGGKTWHLVADGQQPNYKSCVQFVPNSKGQEIVAMGFTGISYSSDMGNSWRKLSEEPFYTFRFVNDSTAYAAGKGRISKLVFH